MYICTDAPEILNYPILEKILDIFILNNHTFFVTAKYSVLEYCHKRYAYKLSFINTEKINIVDLKMLLYKEPFNIHQSLSSTELYFVPKYEYIF